jgi:hypothetical protein
LEGSRYQHWPTGSTAVEDGDHRLVEQGQSFGHLARSDQGAALAVDPGSEQVGLV